MYIVPHCYEKVSVFHQCNEWDMVQFLDEIRDFRYPGETLNKQKTKKFQLGKIQFIKPCREGAAGVTTPHCLSPLRCNQYHSP